METVEPAQEDFEPELMLPWLEQMWLEAEVARARQESEVLAIEKGVLSTFLETQARETCAVIENVIAEQETKIRSLEKEACELKGGLENEKKERDDLRRDLDSQVDEVNGLKENVMAREKQETELLEEIERRKKECGELMEAVSQREVAIEVMMTGIVSAENDLDGAEREIANLRREVEDMVREKQDLETAKREQEDEVDELEKGIKSLNKIVSDLEREKEELRATALQLETDLNQVTEGAEDMARKSKAMKEERKEKETSIEILNEEKLSVSIMLDTTKKELGDKEQQIMQMICVRDELLEIKANQESKILELNEKLGSLRVILSSLQESCNEQTERNERLMYEAGQHRSARDVVTLEMDDAKKGSYKDTENGTELRSRVLEMEKKTEERFAELEKIRAECENLYEAKNDFECRLGMLMKEKETMQKSLLEARRHLNDLEAKFESAHLNSETALALLKNTATYVGQSEDTEVEREEGILRKGQAEPDIQSYAMELEAIKSVYRKKEIMVEDMKKQAKSLQKSAVDARKKKSFWTLVSSATTIFAAIYVAFAVQRR